MEHVGVFAPNYREGTPVLNTERPLHRIRQTQELTQATRSALPPRRQHLVRHNYPMSAYMSNSYRHTTAVTLAAGPVDPQASLNRALQAVQIMNEHRNNRNNARAADRAAETAAAVTPPVVASPRRSGSASPARSVHDASVDPTPVVFDGNDLQCSLS